VAAEAANRRLAAELGADTGAVTNAATILRPPGSYSFKFKPPAPVVLERLEADLSTAAAVTAGITADPTPPIAAATKSMSLRPTVRPGHDPLRALDPDHYVSVLTGQVVGRSRKDLLPAASPRQHAELSCLRGLRPRLVLLRVRPPRPQRLRPRRRHVGPADTRAGLPRASSAPV